MNIAQAKELKVGTRVHYGPVPSATPTRSQPCLELVVTRVHLKWRSSGLGVRSWAGSNILVFIDTAEIGLPKATQQFYPTRNLKYLHLASSCTRPITTRDHAEATQVKWPQYTDADLGATSSP